MGIKEQNSRVGWGVLLDQLSFRPYLDYSNHVTCSRMNSLPHLFPICRVLKKVYQRPKSEEVL